MTNNTMDKRIDRLEKELARRMGEKRPEPTYEERLNSFVFQLFLDGLKHLLDFLKDEDRKPVHRFWSWLHNPRAFRANNWGEPDPVPIEIEKKIFEIAWNCGYAYLKAASIVFDDIGMATRAADLKAMDIPDLSRIPHYGYLLPGMKDPDLKATDWHIRMRNKAKPWREFLEWYQDRDYGTFGPAVDFGRDHKLFGLMDYEGNYRCKVAFWLDIYGSEVVSEIIDLEKINDLDHHRDEL